MTGWLKIFTDNTDEDGSDHKIALGKASWTNGRLDNIREVRLYSLERACSLVVPNTNWHQFDRLIVSVVIGTNKPTRTHQVVQAKITKEHLGRYLVCSKSGNNYSWAIIGDKDVKNFNKIITKSHLDKWITLILPSNDFPYISFGSKGRLFNGNHK